MITKFTLLTIFILATTVFSDTAIVTYHLYTKTDSLTTVSCSDGANGLMSWGYTDLSMMFPYVTAWQPASWNSPQCGSCVKIMWNGKYTYVTVIDMCGVINSAYSHFDMSKQAFLGLFGQQGYLKGTMTANFTIVSSRYCPGNRKVGVNKPHGVKNVQTVSSGQPQSQQSWYKNPQWVKQQHNNRPNLGTQSQKQPQMINIQSSAQSGSTNPLWTKTASTPSLVAASSTSLTSETTQYGGFSYDKQNERKEKGGG